MAAKTPNAPSSTVKTALFRDLDLWRASMELAQDIYRATNAFPSAEAFGLRFQVRRAAVSIPSNIAEGAGRHTNREFLQFLYVARGSLAELETQIELATRLGMWEPDEQLSAKTRRVGQLINGMIRRLAGGDRKPDAGCRKPESVGF